MGMGQNLVPLVNPKIAGKWMFIPLNLVCIGIDPYPHLEPNMLNTPKHQDPLVVFAGSELFLFHCLIFPLSIFVQFAPSPSCAGDAKNCWSSP